MSSADLTDCGIPAVGKVAWGSHFCHFFSKRDDLIQGLVPYFVAGLANHERCIWVTSSPLSPEDARKELALRIPGLEALLNDRQIRILDSKERYLSAQSTVKEDLLERWLAEETDALKAGYQGLRVAGNASFLERAQWTTFMTYEGSINREIRKRRVIALCSYDLKKSASTDVFDVVRNHRFTLDRQGESWEVVETVDRPGGI